MNAQELTVQVAMLQERFDKIEELMDIHVQHLANEIGELKTRLAELERKTYETERRVAILEKGSDIS